MSSQQKNLISIIVALSVAAFLVLGAGLDVFGWMYSEDDSDKKASTSHSTATVQRIIDGDTVDIGTATSSELVRLIGIDTPEIDWEVSGDPEAECYGWEARDFLVEKIEGETVRLTSDSLQPERDSYDRRLAYVYLGEELINQTLIIEGYAREFTVGSGYQMQNDFEESEKAAREGGVGLWSSCNKE